MNELQYTFLLTAAMLQTGDLQRPLFSFLWDLQPMGKWNNLRDLKNNI